MSEPGKNDVFSAIPALDHTEPAIEVDAEEFEKVVRSRRSVRVYTDEGIPEDVMRRCLQLALLAPNSSNMQPWEFYWVRDAEKKKELVRLCLGQPAAATAQELVVAVARLDTWKRNRGLMLEHFAAKPNTPSSVIQYYKSIVPFAYGNGPGYIFAPVKRLLGRAVAMTRPLPRGPAGKADMRVWAHKSTALACENLMLSLRAHGFDSRPIEGMDEERIRKLLGLPGGAEVCMVVSAGKRADNGVYGARVRFDESLFLFEV